MAVILDAMGQEFVPTPTQDLILEVLAARWRLGETSWPFKRSPSVTRAIFNLREHGFVWHKGAIASTDYEQVGMTEMAVVEYCPENYHCPSPPKLRDEDQPNVVYRVNPGDRILIRVEQQ